MAEKQPGFDEGLTALLSFPPTGQETVVADGALLRLCSRFNRLHRQWTSAVDDRQWASHGASEVMPEIDAIRTAWKAAFYELKRLKPTTLVGAFSKHTVAVRLLEWRCGDGEACDFVIASHSEVQSLMRMEGTNDAISDPTIRSGSTGPLSWLNRMVGFTRTSQDQSHTDSRL